MANLKSSVITGLDANPPVMQNSRLVRGVLKQARGTLEITTSEGVGQVQRFCRVPSNALITKVEFACDASGATGTMDVGVYRTAADGGAVVNVDFFASAQAFTAALNYTDITHEADPTDVGSDYGKADIEKPLWQALGLTADPSVMYDIAGTITQATTATSTVNLIVTYVE